MKETDIKSRIKYLEQELAARDRQDGWVIEGLKQELKRLKLKVKK
jgi:hypothetical protein|tara:strand:- start:123 stop:257 length:135 start_codon:yes stop_codon:yes gene_type:complete